MSGRWIWSAGAVLVLGAGSAAMAQEAGAGLFDLLREGRERLLKQYDTDGNGELSPDEWSKAGQSIGNDFRRAAESEFDKDGDGKLSEAEKAEMDASWDRRRKDWEQTIKDRIQKAQDDQLLSKYDEDKDGILNDSEKAKMEADKKAEAEKLEAAKKAVIEAYDTDKNGKLSPEEVQAMEEKIKATLTHLSQVVTASEAMRKADDKTLSKVEQAITRHQFAEQGRQWQNMARQWQGQWQRFQQQQTSN